MVIRRGLSVYADNVFAYFFNPARIRLKKFGNKKLNVKIFFMVNVML